MKQCKNCKKTLPENEFPFRDKKTGRRAKLCKTCYNEKNRRDRQENPERYRMYSKRQYERVSSDPELLEKRRESGRRYYEKHKEAVLEHCRKYRKENKEACYQRIKDWGRRNPDKIKAAVKRYRQTEKCKATYERWASKDPERVRKIRRDSKRRCRAKDPEAARKYDREYRRRKNARLTDRACSEKKRARKQQAPGEFTAQDTLNQFEKQEGACYWCGIPIVDGYHIDHFIPLSRGGSNYPENIVLSCPTCNIRRSNKLPSESFEYLDNHPANGSG